MNDQKQKFNLPLVNAHAHAAMVGFRGIGEDLPLDKWLNDCIWPAEAKMVNPQFVYEQTKIAITEMKENGIAAFMDMYFFEDEVAKAAEEMAMTVVLGEGLLDLKSQYIFDQDLEKTKLLFEKYKNHPYVKVSVAPHSPYTVSEKNLIVAKNLAKQHSAIYKIHAAESKKEFDESIINYGLTPIAYLDKIGVLDENTVLIHCVWLTDEDIKIIAKRNCKVVHCPLSNLKLGSGIAPIAKLLDAGVIVALGTDGAASSNRLDIWEAGKFAGLLQKGINHNPMILPAKQVIKMMTINGMKALGLDNLKNKTISEIEKEIEDNNFDYLYHLQSRDLDFQ